MKEKENFLTRIISEYKQVTWADKKTVFQTTVIVLLIAAFVAFYIMGFDFIFNQAIKGITYIVSALFKK